MNEFSNNQQGPQPQGQPQGMPQEMPPYNGYQQPQYNYWKKQETPEQQKERADIARFLGKAALIYGIIVTFCLYKNMSGVTMPVFAAATIIFMCYCLKCFNVKLKKANWFYAAVIILLSVSNFMTGNSFFIFFNTIGILLLIFVFLLHNVYDDSKWNFSKTTMAVIESFFGSLGCLDDYAKDMKARKKLTNVKTDEVDTDSPETDNTPKQKKSYIGSVILGLVISVPVVGIIIALLAKADVVFKTMIVDYLDIDFHLGTIFGIVITFIVSYFAAYCIMRFFSKKRINEDVKIHKNFEPVVAITVLSIISVVYLAFSMIQILYLFWGGMELPEDYTYAEYAREGFFQLLVVCILNVMIVLFVEKFYRDSRALKLLMTLISLCTYIMIASSCMRMLLYIDAYRLSFLRILVLWTLAVLAVLLVGIIISIYKDSFPLFKYGVVIMSIMYLALSFSHTDYIIARYNLSVEGSDYSEIEDNDSDLAEEIVPADDYLHDISSDDFGDSSRPGDDDVTDDPEFRDDERNERPRQGGHLYFDDDSDIYEDSYQDTVGIYGLIDYDYLANLSTDAAPVIATKCPEDVKEEYFENHAEECKDKRIRHFNVSRYIAGSLSK